MSIDREELSSSLWGWVLGADISDVWAYSIWSFTEFRGWRFNTLRPRQNGRHFPDDIFKCIFLSENEWSLIKISLKFVPKVTARVKGDRCRRGYNQLTLINSSSPGKLAASSQTTFSSACSWMKMLEVESKFHYILFLMVKLTISQRWFR